MHSPAAATVVATTRGIRRFEVPAAADEASGAILISRKKIGMFLKGIGDCGGLILELSCEFEIEL